MGFYCSDPEGWGPTSRTRPFDFTLCFNTALLVGTCVVSFLACVVRVILLRKSDVRPRAPNSRHLLKTKLILIFIITFASVAKIFIAFRWNESSLLSVSQVFAFLAIRTLTKRNHLCTRSSSTIILLFWPVYTCVFFVLFRTLVLSGWYLLHVEEFAVECAITFFGAFSFGLECVGPEAADVEYVEIGPDSKESPLERANVFSRWFFMWLSPLMKLGASRYITEDDVYSLPTNDQSSKLAARLDQALKEKYSLHMALFKAYGGPFFIAAGLKIIQDLLSFSQPQLLRLLLSFISKYQSATSGLKPDPLEGFGIAILMFIAAVTQSVVLHQYFHRCYETGMRIRAGLVAVIYRKSLVLNNDAKGNMPTGDVVNLASVDSTRLQDLCTYGLMAISGPFQIVLAFVSLYDILGWPAFVGIAIMIITLPLNTMIARYLKRLQEKQMKNSDKRTRLMSELLNNIKSVKLYSWEESFIKRVHEVRNQELNMLRKIGITGVLSNAIWTVVPLLVSFSSFAVAAYTSSTPLTADIIFPSMSLFLLLGFPLAMFSVIISSLVQALVSLKRISSFLTADELQDYVQDQTPNSKDNIAVSICNGEFRWSQKAKESTLQDINLTVKNGQLVGVLGRVGCGKSSLLAAIIGQMELSEGVVNVQGQVAYVPQTPWIMSASIRENILFSHEFDEEFYNQVLDACELRYDLTLFSDGDLTEVGEKGITLSGGQRARISLARACYSRADIYILDDVLAALDSHVARRVFDHVIGPAGLLAHNARIVVTNSVTFLKQYDLLILLRRGIIMESGTYSEAVNDARSAIGQLISEHSTENPSGSATPLSNMNGSDPRGSASSTTVSTGSISEEKRKNSNLAPAVLRNAIPTALDTAKKEHREQGQVKREVYVQYIKSASIPAFLIFLACIILQQAMTILSNVTLKEWADDNSEKDENARVSVYLFRYGLYSLLSGLFSVFGGVLLWVFCVIRSARHLHNSMLLSVLYAPLSFFDSTPSGRVLNLFSRDVYVVDQALARVFSGFFRTMANVGGILLVLGYSFPLFLPAIIPFTYFYHKMMIYYLATSRELKRLDSVSRSPIFTWFQESLGGLDTIRAFHHQKRFIANLEKRLDRNQMFYMGSITVNRWLGIRLELLGSAIIFLTALLSLVSLVSWGGVNAGLVGLVLSYCLSVTGSLNWVVRSASEVEQNIVSVERILGCKGLPSEAPAYLPSDELVQPWPSEGAIEFRSYSMRYRPELDLVLNNILLKIPPRAKIGICGRTGAGKSSLLLALFRVIEPASGAIFIDDVDISTLGLHELRTAISIIPQEPQLFEGTMRENVDPTGVSTDADIWESLRQAHLKDYVLGLPGALDAPVREGGSSLSSGQRQLLCFARALLRKTKIIVLDEATSAVDLETDRAIQDIIRGPQFADITMLTIAHRLNTIIHSDRILVLDAGKVAEFDSPSDLLMNKDSIFYSLAMEEKLLDGKQDAVHVLD